VNRRPQDIVFIYIPLSVLMPLCRLALKYFIFKRIDSAVYCAWEGVAGWYLI